MRGECFFCGRKGHYAIECKFLKKVQSNFVKLENKDDVSEEVWDFEATYAVDEDDSKDEEGDFEATYAVEENVVEEEDWDLSEQNDELWIEELDIEDNLEIPTNTVIATHEDDMVSKTEVKDYMVVKEENDEFIITQEEIELVATQPGVQDWLADAGIIKGRRDKEMPTPQGVQMQGEPNEIIQTKAPENISRGLKDERSKVISRIKNKESARDDRKKPKKIEDHSEMSQNHSTQFKAHGKLSEERQFDQLKRGKVNIEANIKKPPDKEDQLGIKGEY